MRVERGELGCGGRVCLLEDDVYPDSGGTFRLLYIAKIDSETR